eukprot:5287416-Prymnesium_polylepis.1
MSSNTEVNSSIAQFNSAYTTFCSSQQGHGSDNPTDPNTLTDIQAARSVVLSYSQTSSLQIIVAIKCAPTTLPTDHARACCAHTAVAHTRAWVARM